MYVYVVTNNDGECICVTPNLKTAKRAVLREGAIHLCSYVDDSYGDYTSQDFKEEYGELRKLMNSFQEIDEEYIEYSPCETCVIKKMEVED